MAWTGATAAGCVFEGRLGHSTRFSDSVLICRRVPAIDAHNSSLATSKLLDYELVIMIRITPYLAPPTSKQRSVQRPNRRAHDV